MSLVSFIYNFGMTIIVGDLTITSDEEKQLIIPTINKVPVDFTEDVNRPVSFQKKTHIIKDKLALGCTGKVQVIKDIVSYTTDFFLHREVNEKNLLLLLDELKLNVDYSEASAIFILIRSDDPPYNIGIWRFGLWSSFEVQHIGPIFSSGTGAEEWTNYFTNSLPYLQNIQNNTISVRSTIDLVLMTNMHFVAQDIVSPDNFKQGWAIPVDVIYAERIFKRIEKVCYVTWKVDIAEESWWVKPSTIIKVTNQGDCLYMHNYNGTFQLYGTTSIGSKVEILEFPDKLDFSAEIVCSSVEVFSNGELLTTLQSIYNNTANGEVIKAEMIDGHLAFLLHTDFTTKLEDSIREFCQ